VGDTDITGIYKRNNRDVILDTSNYILATSNIIVKRLGDYIPYTWAINSQSFNLNYTLGNVGIGTTEPLKKLHIVHPNGELIRIETDAEGTNQVSGIEFGVSSYNTESRSKITSTTATGTGASDLQFSTASSANNSSLKFIITPTGNIGIGTPTPNNILQIGNAGRLRIANNISDYTILGTADTDDTTNTKIELSGNSRSGSAGNISYVATNTDGYHKFITNSTEERVRITASGNVGIGTTNPSQLLTLYGNNAGLKIRNSAETTAANKSVAINLDNGNNDEWIIGNSNRSLAFAYNDGLATSNRMIIDGVSGNIGIATSPTSNYKLNILGNIKVAGNIIPDTSNAYDLGSSLNKWKDLYLSGDSIYLDDLVLSRGSNISLSIKDVRGNYRDVNLSNINLYNSSNKLTIGIDVDGNITYSTSNKIFYPVTTPNINNTAILDNVNDIIITTSNFAINTSNKLTNIINTLDNSQSNYVLTTSNLISQRITDLTTDMITENLSADKKFIINNRYDNSLLINGDLTVNSNLIVLGETTRLDTIVYTTERLEVVNDNNTTRAFMVQQNTLVRDIFVASNMNTEVFKIANNGDVNISGIYKRDNRDVFLDTSNYIQSTSNNLINYGIMNDANNSNYIASTSNILYTNIAYLDVKLKLLTLKVNLNEATANDYIQTTSNNLINKVRENDENSSNYIQTTSNNLINKVRENDENSSNYILTASKNSSNYILTASNNLINKVRENDENSSNYIQTTSNNLINKVKENDENSSNYILTASNNLINKVKENDENSSNYILTASNNLINKVKENDENSSNYISIASKNASNYILTASNNLINKVRENDENSSNYILTASNNLINKVKENDENSSNYILTSSNNLINKVRENDENSSNYILTSSNNLINKVKENDENSSNYILTSSNNLINKVRENDENSSNYILTSSNNLINKVKENDENSSNYILTASNNLINKVKENDENSSNYILTASNNLINKVRENDENSSNYILTASNNLINKVKENDENSSNYILTASNNLINKVKENDENSSNYILTSSNNLINKVRENDENSSNYIQTTSNNLINKVRENDENSSNYIQTTSNNLINKVRENDENSSNYIQTTSNNLINKVKENDENSSNYILTSSNNLINKVKENDENSSNYILTASNNLINKVKENDENSSNYILTASNNLINKVKENDENSSNYISIASKNASNYILTSSNNLINKVKENDENSSNYILTASNNLINKVRENDENSSNYILTASNNLINKVRENDENSSNYIEIASKNSSNYILTASNNLINKVKENDENSSNYILTASNNLINKVKENDENSSNYILTASNNLIAKVRENDENSSNYILSTNNLISQRITDLTTDMITEVVSANNKFIVNNRYNNSLEVNGSLTINSNLIVLGDSTQLDTIVYSTERLEVVNANNTTTALMIQQNSPNSDIFVASNMNAAVFRIANNGDVLISGIYKRNNRDVILDTSNYILTASNNLINKVRENDENASNYIAIASKNASNYILTASNNLINKVRENDENASNYILTASNNLINKVRENDENSSNYILTASNNLINKVRENDENASNYILTASNNLINKVRENDENSSNYIAIASENASNYILTASNNLINKVRENDENSSNYIAIASENASNYILTASNNLINKVRENDENASNYILTASNNLINKVRENDENASNYILTASNNLINKVRENDENSSNYILTASNNLINKVRENDENSSNYIAIASENASNYILTASNNLINKVRENDENSSNYIAIASENASNYILTASNNLINKVRENDENSSNYIAIASENASNYILTASNNIINKVRENDENSSNYIAIASENASNYILTASNNLINKVRENDENSSNYIAIASENASNYILTASNNLINKVRENDENSSNYIAIASKNASNYILTSSNNLINKVRENDENSSNYILTSSNNLINKVRENDENSSNYVITSSNNLINKVRENDENSSNYVITASNNLINKVKENDENSSNYIAIASENASNYVLTASNNLINKVRENDENSSNYVGTTSNLISQRITDLRTDMITEDVSGANKFIVNNIYNNNLEVNGSLTINSNLIVLGDTTRLDTIAYTTERLEVVNANITTTAFMVQQKTTDRDIFVASNMNVAVFRIANNGDVDITGNGSSGVYKRNNRDVIWDTSNYVMNASNMLISKMRENDDNSSNYVSAINNNLINQITELNNTQNTFVILASSNLGEGLTDVVLKMTANDRNASNYVLATSNIIQRRINEITTDKIVEGVKNKFIIEDRYNSNLEVNGRLVVNSNLIVNSLATMRNSLDITGNVNFTGELYKNGMLYPNGKTYTGSSSILSQFSPIQTQFTMYKNVVEKSGSGWQFIDNNINVVDDKVQGFCVRIKPNHYSSKILINLNCHIGIDYGTDARWWGLRLYRKIGEAGVWEHITDADGTGSVSGGTSCWLSHNLGAETSSSSYFIANITGAYYDIPLISTAEAIAAGAAASFVYYTVKWCSLLGDNTQDGKLYLNRPAVINALNAPIVSSSWNVSEIWQLETSYFPKGGIVTKYTPTQTQFSIYKDVVEKTGGGWEFIDNNISIINNNIQGFCVRIMPNHYTSKILINLNCHIGIDYGTDARWWGLRLYRKIGEAGAWEHITDADGTASGGSGATGTTCWLSHNLGAEASTYSYFIANVSGAYYDTPNVMDTFVYYTAMWCSQLGDMSQNGKLYLNRPATYNTANTANTAVLSSSWNAQEIWQRETTFIPKNAVICQNMSIQTLFNIYRNIVVKSGGGWQFIDNNTSIIGDKIQGFCVRIKPTHISSKVLVHLSCHIGIDYGTDARWWGLRLYRKIGEAGAWTHITGADGNNLIDNKGTSCWLSHNLGAEASTSSYFVANISGSFFDLPATSTEFVYYTAMWCSQLGDNTQDGKIYLNRPATYNEANSAVLSSSWNAQEIWQLGTPYEPTEYSIINIFNNNNVGIGTTNPVCKLDVNGTINAVNYSTISDRRYKKDIRDLDSSLELINRLSPVSYLTINQTEGDRRNYGFIAQDLHKVIPEAVNVPVNDSNNYTIEYMSLIPLLTKSIQDLTETVGWQQKTIDDLTARLDDLTATLARHNLV
jgi:hypothetical protein